jgi:hypothetical protein
MDTLSCPVCERQTDSLKQYRVIRRMIAVPVGAVFSSVVLRSCPQCMRAFIWKSCLINGLTTWIVGYIVLVPYTLALTFATMRMGHSWPVLRGISPEMHLKRIWGCEPTWSKKLAAGIAFPFCLVPGIGLLIWWWVFWRTRWSSGWAYSTAETALFVASLPITILVWVYFRYLV